jgi:hypothetical protein
MSKRPRRYRKEAAARARLARQAYRAYTVEVTTVMADDSVPDDDNLNCNGASFECGYIGGVHYSLPDSDSDSEFGGSDIDWDSESESGESVVELEGDELDISLAQMRDEIEALAELTSYQEVAGPKTMKNWQKVEKNRALGYNGHSKRTRERRLHDARAREDFREYAKTR